MSRKDYIAIAGIIKNCKHGISTASQAKLAEDNFKKIGDVSFR